MTWDGRTAADITGPVALSARRNATQTITRNVDTTIGFDTIENQYNFGGISASSAMAVPLDGVYRITGALAMDYSGTNLLFNLLLRLNGAASRCLYRGPGSPVNPSQSIGSTVMPLSAGTTIGLSVFHNHGSTSLDIYGGATYRTAIDAQWLGSA